MQNIERVYKVGMLKKYKRVVLGVLVAAACLLSIQLYLAEESSSEKLYVAVLYAGGSKTWRDIYSHYSQPLLMNLEVKAIDIERSGKVDLSKYDLIYPDSSVAISPAGKQLQKDIREYVAAGGAVFLENDLYRWLPKELSGAREFKKLDGFPQELAAPPVRPDLGAFQKLILDFYDNYRKFERFDELKDKPYGYGMVTDTAIPIVTSGELALYTLNRYGKGYVFFTNPLLPNLWYINGFDMLPKTREQPYFNNTVSAANQMIRNEAAAFLSKQKFGYALKKVFGPYGRPAAAWQNHFEVLSAIRDHSMEKWIDLARKHNLIPSYSLARGVYEWYQRYESIGYQLNYGSNAATDFGLEQREAFYTPGKHPVVDGVWLNQARYDKNESYFSEIKLPYRAYPYVADVDKDGVMDIVSGSSDGYFYYYHGLKKGADWVLDKAKRLQAPDGKELNTGRFSAPVLFDLDYDGDLDLVSGSEKGDIYFFENTGGFKFRKYRQVLSLGNSYTLSAPDIGDVDGDKIMDLVVGTGNGDIFYFKGRVSEKGLEFTEKAAVTDSKGVRLKVNSNAAPRVTDLNGDGRNDLAVGANDGYIHKLINKGKSFEAAGCFDGKGKNYLGNLHYKYGNNAVPFFADINGDGKNDLIVGRLEYGQMTVGIDSPWFPYRDELVEALKYAKDNYVNVEPHYFSNLHKSAEEEKAELELHKKAFAYYGLQWDGKGTNLHTWHLNGDDPTQTLWALHESGLKWISGFEPPGSSGIEPSGGTEYTWILPFYLCKGTDRSDMLVYNTSLGNMKGLNSYVGSWDTIISYYYHTEYNAVKNPKQLENVAAKLEEFCNNWDYNFMGEDQMAKSLMAQLNAHVDANTDPFEQIVRKLQGKASGIAQFEISLKPVVKADSSSLLKGPYKNVAGVKVEAGEKFDSVQLDTDADIYMQRGKDLYIGLNRSVKVFASKTRNDRFHIESANLPVQVKSSDNAMKIRFLDGGMQQLRIYSPKGKIFVSRKDWKLTKQQDGSFMLVRYRGPTEITVGEMK